MTSNTSHITVSQEAPVLNWCDLSQRCADDIDLVCQIVEAFAADADSLRNDLDQAVRDSDTDMLAKVAHKLKGSAAAISATALSEAALQLETAARQNDLGNLHQLHEDTVHEIQRLMVFLDHPDWVSKAKGIS